MLPEKMKISGKGQFPAILSPDFLPGLDLQERRSDRRPQQRKFKNPGFSGAGFRLKKDGAPAGKRSKSATPLLRWKFDDGDSSVANDKPPESSRRGRRKVRNGGGVSVSARKLAAGLWQLRPSEAYGCGGESLGLQKRSFDRLGFKPGVGHVGVPFVCHPNSRDRGTKTKDLLQSPLSVSGPKNGILCKLEHSLLFPYSAMEGTTKWDPGCSKTSDEVYRFCGHMKLFKDQQITTVSAVSALQVELEQAHTRIHEIETEYQSSKKKLKQFFRKLSEERASWQSREREKMRAIIDDIKDDLKRERKNCHRMEIVNSKLVSELAEAKLSAKQLMQDYEKERKTRELMEEVCDELAKEIGEDKAEVEAMKRESMKILEEAEEERKMLQMAEVWREERVQMKLVDAKLVLEAKYSQLSKLMAELEAFLRSRSATLDVMEVREAELFREAASAVNIQDITEFSYVPPNSDDLFSVFKDLQYSLADHASQIHTVSPEVNGFNKILMQRYANGFINQNGETEEDGSDWETVSHAEVQGSTYSPKGSNPSANRIHRDSNVSRSGTEWEDNAGHDTPNTEISEVCSVSARQSKKASSVARLWNSCPGNDENHKIVTVEGMKRRISNGRISNEGIISPDQGSGEGGPSPRSLVGQWSSSDPGNPHINRGMRGCIEWPRGIQKNSLKAKLLEARMQSQKIQLHNVLKQKI